MKKVTSLLGNILEIPEAWAMTSEGLWKRLLENRGIDSSVFEEGSFWEPWIEDLHDPFLFPQMDAAVERILLARESHERVVIFGDYDVDGVSSTAMLVRFFTMIGISVSYRIPHRTRDGYGMKGYFFDELASKDVKLVISVDCGTRDIEVIREAKKLGIDVIVTDHHAIPEVIPEEAIAIISPKLPATTYPFSGLSGSGTAFKLLSAVAMRLYPDPAKHEQILTSFIDFAALGTVGDMMPLTGENRTIVKLGLQQLAKSRSPGLRRLIAGKLTHTADCIGFHIGPRINAAGRMEHAEIALQALTCSEARVDELLGKIEELNTRRKGSTERFTQEAIQSVDPNKSLILFVSTEIDHGIIGLVAGRLAERFGKPAIACVFDGEKYFGSARSPENYDITEALTRVKDCFIAFGGHAQAAGFTISSERFAEFCERIEADAQKYCSGASVAGTAVSGIPVAGASISEELSALPAVSWEKTGKTLKIDAVIPFIELTLGFVRDLERVWPFGMAFPKPLFMIEFDSLPRSEFLGTGELHLRFESPKGIKMNGFGLWPLFSELKKLSGRVGMVVEIDRESWQGRESVALFVRDVCQL